MHINFIDQICFIQSLWADLWLEKFRCQSNSPMASFHANRQSIFLLLQQTPTDLLFWLWPIIKHFYFDCKTFGNNITQLIGYFIKSGRNKWKVTLEIIIGNCCIIKNLHLTYALSSKITCIQNKLNGITENVIYELMWLNLSRKTSFKLPFFIVWTFSLIPLLLSAS